MALLLLISAGGLPVVLFLVLLWFLRLLTDDDVPQDILGRDYDPKSATLMGRFRSWLTAKPKRLDYRRDKRGRFRRVRRG